MSAAQTSSQLKTHTSLSAETREVSGKTIATFSASVQAEDGTPASGTVALVDGHRELAGAALDAAGKATLKLDSLTTGNHTVHAVYHPAAVTTASGSASSTSVKAFTASVSDDLDIHPQDTPAPDFSSPALTPATLSLTAGNTGASVIKIDALNGFTGFISLSCSSLPVGATCTFTPANLQVASGVTSVTADLSLQTTAPGGQSTTQLEQPRSASPLVLAVLLPGVLGLGFFGRRSKVFGRVMMLIGFGLLSVLGTTACSPLYRYHNHPPTANNGTPAGTYTVVVTAQTSNGVTATTHSTSLGLTVTTASTTN